MKIASGARRPHFVRTLVTALAALVVGGMVSLGMTAPAFAVSPMTFTLKLTNKVGVPLTAYDVYAVDLTNPSATSGTAATAGGQAGYYTMPVISGDSYTLQFSPNGASANSGTIQFLGGTAFLAGATDFIPSSSNNFLAASIATGSTITGKVTGPTGAALKNAEVDAYQFDGTNWTTSIYTTTSSTGAFTFVNAVPGSYRFEFYAPGGVYPPIYSGSATTLTGAATTFVPVGTTAVVNQKMTVGTGAMTGTALVSDSTDGNPEEPGTLFYDTTRVPVAIPVTTEVGGVATVLNDDKAIAGTPANGTGVWSIHNLPAGNYVVEMEINDFGEGTQYLSHQSFPLPGDPTPTLAQATVFTVTSGHTISTGISIFPLTFLLDGADPRYTIEDLGNIPIQNASVTVAPVNDPFDFVTGTSDSSGNVRLYDGNGNIIYDDGTGQGLDHPLTVGYYTVTVIDPSQSHEPYRQTVYLGYGTTDVTINLGNLIAAPGFTGDPVITNTDETMVGTQYSASATATRPDATVTYQWFRGTSPIFGATGPNYTSTGADLGDQLSVQATASSFGFQPVTSDIVPVAGGVTTIGDAPVVDPANEPSISPSTGVFVGTTLQANAGDWTIDGNPASGLSFSYVWTNDLNSDTGTGSTYVVQPADIGANFTVTVTAHESGYTDSAPTSSPATVLAVAHPAPLVTKSPVITHVLSHGVTTYSVSNGTWNTTGLAYSYAWSLGSTPVGTDSPTITSTTVGTLLPAADPLTVIVTATKTGYLDGNSASLVAVKGTDFFFQSADPTIFDHRTGVDVSGTDCLNVGDHLSIDQHGTWLSNDGLVTPSGYTYQWYRNGVAVKGATTATYIVTSADMTVTNDTQIDVVETPVSAYYATAHGDMTQVGQAMHDTEFLSANPATPYLNLPLPTASVSGIPVDGNTVTATVGSWGTTGVTDTYQWSGCGGTVAPSCTDANDETQYVTITGATKSTLLLNAVNYGAVFVTVTGNKPGFIVPDASAPAIVLDGGAIYLSAAPRINGIVSATAHTGATLTVTGGTPSVTGATVVETWQTSPDGSTWGDVGVGTSYTPNLADFTNGFIRVEETAIKPGSGLSPATLDSFTYAIDPGTLKVVHLGIATTTASTYTYHTGTYSPTGVSATLQWYDDSTPAGTDLTHTRGVADVGAAVWVDATYSEAGYANVDSILVVQRGVTTTSPESIVGTRYGDTLTVSNTAPFSNAQGEIPALTYQWYSNGAAISHATGVTFTPSSAYIGKHITVRVEGTTPMYATGVVTSGFVSLGAGLFSSPANPTISYAGTLEPGVVATAVPDTGYGTTGITFHYQWQRSTNGGSTWASITGATLSHYTPVATDVLDDLRVIVTASKTGYTTLALTSETEVVSFSPTLATITPPVVSGSTQVGSPLTLSTGAWNTPTLTYTYQWYVDGTAMPGAVTTSFTPLASEAGDLVYATVTASRVGYDTVERSEQLGRRHGCRRAR